MLILNLKWTQYCCLQVLIEVNSIKRGMSSSLVAMRGDPQSKGREIESHIVLMFVQTKHKWKRGRRRPIFKYRINLVFTVKYFSPFFHTLDKMKNEPRASEATTEVVHKEALESRFFVLMISNCSLESN